MKKSIGSLIFLLALSGAAQAQTSSWEAMNRGLLHLLVYTIEIDPVDSLVMYAGTEYGNLYKSTDGGFNWMLSRNGIPSNYNAELVSGLHLDAANRRHLYAGFGGRQSTNNLFESTDAGVSWKIVSTPAIWKNAGVLHILRTTAGLFCGLGWWNGIAVLRSGTTTWNVTSGSGVQCIAARQSTPTEMYYGSSGGTAALFRTRDGGMSWSVVENAFPGATGATGVRALTYAADGALYAGVTGVGHGLYRLNNGGSSWQMLVSTDQISEIAVHPLNPDIIYISAIGTGVQRSLDGGKTWTRIMDGLPTTDVMRVRIASGWPVRVFAVTLKHGIFRMVDEEITRTKAGGR